MTNADTDDARTTFDATFISKRVLTLDGTRLVRLYFVDSDGDALAALLAPSRGRTVAGLRTGQTYRITDALGPIEPACRGASGALLADLDTTLRAGVTELGIDDPFVVVDGRTHIQRIERA